MCKPVCVIFLTMVFFLSGCAANLDYPRRSSLSLPDSGQTVLGKHVLSLQQAHPGQSGFYFLSSGYDAFVARAVFINAAEKTVDAQQFIFRDDVLGNLILERLFDAADRGVRIRLLLDDFDQAGKDKRLAGISAHPNIEVRLFNPVGGWRSTSLSRGLAYLFGPDRLKSRMHNKVLVVDNTIAFVGGRDIADQYYYARDDFNFTDLDLMAVGPLTHTVSDSFDLYWNDSLAVPIEAFVSQKRAPACLEKVRDKFQQTNIKNAQSEYIRQLDESRLLAQLQQGSVPLIWCSAWFLYDDPSKILKPEKETDSNRLVAKLEKIIDSARRECLITTPYYVPGRSAMGRFELLELYGVDVKLLVNSLASTDHISTYGGYNIYRQSLLD